MKPLEIELKREEVEDSIAELERLLQQAEEAYEMMAWESGDEEGDI
jgi:hypothetical protein